MLYQGSKSKLAKYIVPFIHKYMPDKGCLIEPFCGGLNITQHVRRVKYCSDSNKYLIAMWEAVLYKNWDPPKTFTLEEYLHVRDNKDLYPDYYVGWFAFCCFGGMFFSGYSHPNKAGQNYQLEYYNNIMKQKTQLHNVILRCCRFNEVEIKSNAVIYCDPPYANTKGYSTAFSSYHFWLWCRELSKTNVVLISEYEAPPDFIAIWYKVRTSQMRPGSGTQHIEKLFIHKDHL